jgi:hypothetical protein
LRRPTAGGPPRRRPVRGNPHRGLAEEFGVIVGEAGEEHHGTPPFLAPQLGFGAGWFGSQFVGLSPPN